MLCMAVLDRRPEGPTLAMSDFDTDLDILPVNDTAAVIIERATSLGRLPVNVRAAAVTLLSTRVKAEAVGLITALNTFSVLSVTTPAELSVAGTNSRRVCLVVVPLKPRLEVSTWKSECEAAMVIRATNETALVS